MAAFFANNWGTILVGLLLTGVVAAIVAKLVKERKRGGCAGCGCGDCPGKTDCDAASGKP